MLTYHWSRAPGKIVNKLTGIEVVFGNPAATGPAFYGSVRDWYDTLPPTLNDLAEEAGGADSLFVGYDVLTMLEHTRQYSPYKEGMYPLMGKPTFVVSLSTVNSRYTWTRISPIPSSFGRMTNLSPSSQSSTCR